MPSLAHHQSLQYVKALYLGNPGSGKTGSLDSLVHAGYKLAIYDFDNNLTPLVQYVNRNNPERADAVHFQTFTDKFKGVDNLTVMNGLQLKVMPMTDGVPKAFSSAMKQLTHWKVPDGDMVEDLGAPSEFGPEWVVVIDSLTTMSNAAFRYVQAMNPSAKEQMTYYGSAQQLILNAINLLCSANFKANVIVLAHVDYRENEFEVIKGFPRTVGSALKDQIAAYFNCVLLAEASGSGNNVKRVIRTNSTGIVDLKNPISFKIPDSLPLETGLATFFQEVTKL